MPKLTTDSNKNIGRIIIDDGSGEHTTDADKLIGILIADDGTGFKTSDSPKVIGRVKAFTGAEQRTSDSDTVLGRVTLDDGTGRKTSDSRKVIGTVVLQGFGPATGYSLSGPSGGAVGVPSAPFTVALTPAGGSVASPVMVTPSAGAGGGTFSPASVVLTTASPSAQFTYTPGSTGAKTISCTDNGGLTDPAPLTYTVTLGVATGYSLSGPSGGAVGTPSTPFTVALTPTGGTVTGTVTVTPSDGGGGGTFTPASVGLTTGAPSATFTYTPGSAGAKTISTTDNGGLTDPAPLTYTATTGGALNDGDPVLTWPDSSVNANHGLHVGTPIFKVNILNSKPVVRLVGTAYFNLSALISGVHPWTVFAVMKPTAVGGTIAALAGNGVSQHPYGIVVAGSTLYISNRSSYRNYPPFDTAFHVFTTTNADGASTLNLWVDGTFQTPGGSAAAVNVGDFATLGIGGNDGDYAEAFAYNVSVNMTDRANLEKYMGTKYGLTVAGGTAVQPDTVTGLVGWWKADSLG